MKPTSTRVMLINPNDHSVTEQYIDGTQDSICDLIGGEVYESIRLDAFTVFIVNNEGRHGFMIKNLREPIFGKALVVGQKNKNGEFTSTPFSDEGVRHFITHWIVYG